MSGSFQRSKTPWPGLLLLAAALVGPETSQAQRGPQEELPPGVRSSDIPVGSLFIRPILALRNAGYDSNVDLTPAELETNDVTATITGGVRLAGWVGGSGSAAFEQTVDYVYFRDTEEDRGWNTHTIAELEAGLGSFRLQLEGHYHNTRQRYNLEVKERARRQTGGGHLGLRTDPGRGLSFELGARYDAVRFATDTSFQGQPLEDLDRDSYGAEALGYLEFGGSHLLGGYSRWRDDYKSPLNFRDADQTRIFGGMELDPESDLKGTFRIGWGELEPDDVDREGYSSLYLDGELRYEPHEDTRLTFSFVREPEPSRYQDNVFFTETGVAVDLLQYVSYHWAVVAAWRFANNTYPEPTTLPGAEGPAREDDLNILRFGLLYRAFGNFHVGASAAYRNRSSNVPIQEESRWQLTTTLGYLP